MSKLFLRRFAKLLVLYIVLTLVTGAFSQASPDSSKPEAPSNGKYAVDRILVKFRKTTGASARSSVHALLGTRSLKQFTQVQDLEVVGLPQTLDVRGAVKAYRQRPEVEFAEPDYTVHLLTSPNDPLFSQLWNLLNTGQSGGTSGDDVGATLAWNLSTGNHSVVVATIDTGIDYTHPDLIPNLFHDASVCNGIDDGSNGCYGIAPVYGSSDPFDNNGHGTHVAGTIGASGNNGMGLTGINWNVQIVACKFLDINGFGQTSDAITCLDYVLSLKNAGYNVVATNNSWGGSEYSQALVDAIQAQQDAGILFIAASGNDFGNNDLTPTYPANIALPNVISVAATNRSDLLASFSNTGVRTVHLGAPGQEILSTLPGNSYGTLSGTSMAAPHVSGAVALLAAQNATLDWRGRKNALLAGGDTRSSLAQTITGKRLNINGAMTCSGKQVETRLQPAYNAIAGTANAPITLEELNIKCAAPGGGVVVTVSPGSTITLVDDGSGVDSAAGDGIYSAQWIPPAVGSYSLTFPNGDVVQAEVLNNYTVTPTNYQYVSITGTNLNLGDDSVAQVTSPFTIPFGGGSFTTLQVGSNGTISFTDAVSPFLNNVIPGLVPVPVTVVAPFWGDIYPVAGSDQNVYWAVTGSAPNRQLVIEWRNVRAFQCHSDSSAVVTFEVIFSEGSSNVLFEYADTNFGNQCYFEDAGARATVGVQVSPTVGTMWTVNDPVITSGSALLWTPGSGSIENPIPTVLSVSPPTVEVGGPGFTLTVNGSGFVPTSAVSFGLATRPTVYVSSTELQADIPAEAITSSATAGSTYVAVVNPPPGGGESNLFAYPLTSPAPVISSIYPTSATAGSFSFSLMVNGSGFAWGQSVVYWNGTPLTTYGVSVLGDSEIFVGVPYYLISSPGTAQVTVVNSSPGGGTSNAATFTVGSTVDMPVFLQPPSLVTGQANLVGLTSAAPVRFLGWKYAAQAGSQYLQSFQRPRAQALLPPPVPGQQVIPGNGRKSSGTAALSPAGLGLRSLLPADFLPTATAAGDFNGDGIPDWAVANGGSNNLWVYLGRGDGTFTQATVIPLTGLSPLALAAADLRNNGKLDLVVAEADSGSIGVLLGNGDGTFGLEKTYFVPGAPLTVAVADLNKDGHPDIVASILSVSISGPIASLLGDGAGGFGAPQYEPLPGYIEIPIAMAVADFENNGKPDAVIVDPVNGASILVNDGTGKYKAGPWIYSPFNAETLAVAAGDVNEDGCLDVFVSDALGLARLFLGNCDGTFQAQSNQLGQGDLSGAMTLVDVDGDGHLDLIYSGVSSVSYYGQIAGNLLGVHLGDGKGNFSDASVYRGGQTSFALAVADFNRDGHQDVVTANQDSDSATMFLNDGKGGFGAPQGEYVGYINGATSSGPVNAPYTSYSPADVNGDGKQDLVVIEVGPGYPNPFQATVMLNDGTGKFGPAVHSPVAEGTAALSDYILGDFRNTGKPDLVTVSYQGGPGPQMAFAANSGGGTFASPSITTLTDGGVLATGDFNRDGKLDLALATIRTSATMSITIYSGNGDGTFNAGTPITVSTVVTGHWPQGLWAGDFNGDGKTDLLLWIYENLDPPQANNVYELLGNGDGTFAPATLVVQNLSGMAVGDFNHDGRPDIVDNVNQFTSYPLFTPPQFTIYLCQSDGSFVSSNTYAPYAGQAAFEQTFGTANGARYPSFLGDFNGDGNLDLAAFEQTTDTLARVYYVQFLLGNGDGTFTPTYQSYLLYGTLPVAAADLTGDGRADLVESDPFTSTYQLIPAVSGPALQLQLVADPVIGTKGTAQISLGVASASSTQVTMSASDPAISVPSSVTIPAGSLTQQVSFTIGSSFNSTHVFSIQGTTGGSTATAYGTQATGQGQYGVVLYLYYTSHSTYPGLSTADYQLGMNSLTGYSTSTTLSCVGLPAGATCQFGTGTLAVGPGGSAATSLIVSTTSATPLGEYAFTVQASDGVITATTNATLSVGDFSVSITPGTLTALQGSDAAYTVNVTAVDNYSASLTGTCTGIPSPAACSFNGPLGTGISTPLNIQTGTLGPGTYDFTVALSNGSVTRSASAQLLIDDYSATFSSSTLTIGVGQSGSTTASVAGLNGFSDVVALSCIAPAGASCTVNPSSVTPSATGTPATLTITVTQRPSAQPAPVLGVTHGGKIALFAISGMLGGLLVMSGGSSKRRRLRHLVALAGLGLLVSCGGGGGSSTGGVVGGNTSFTVTLQGTSDFVTKNLGTVTVNVP